MRTRGLLLLFVAAATLVVAGCGPAAPRLQDLGLPGSSVDGYEIRVQFVDALDLVPLAVVKLDGVKVGVVEKLDLSPDLVAEATLKIKKEVLLPSTVTARIGQSSLLGEKYVELVPGSAPTADGATRATQMVPGALIPKEKTGAAVEVEQLLGAVSVLLNGGGIGHLQQISQELSATLDGREGTVRQLLRDLDASVSAINERRGDIVKALEGTDRFARTLADQSGSIEQALDVLPTGIRVLADQEAELTRALVTLGSFGRVAERVIRRSSSDVVANLKLLNPILKEIAKAAPAFFSTLDTLLTYPFARNIYGGMAGDYAQLAGELEIDLDSLGKDLANPGPALGDPNPQIQCGEFGSNCRPGPLTPKPKVSGKPSPASSVPALGPALLEVLGGAGR